MGYICVKACRLCGESYRPGQAIPEEALSAHRANMLRAGGYIAEDSAPEMVSVMLEGTETSFTPDEAGKLLSALLVRRPKALPKREEARRIYALLCPEPER